MIELNLLPDVKLDYIKAQKYRRLMFGVSILLTVGAVLLLGALMSVSILQKKHLSDLSRDIKTESSKLKNEPQINKILTVQNQLASLTALHAAKPAASNLFEYLNQTTPAKVSISSLDIDFGASTITITGSADALSSVNQYVDTLKFTTYSTGDTGGNTKAFSNIVLGSFGLNSGATGSQAATYTINLAYDKLIFDISQKVKLSVPNTTTTRSAVDKPADLFQASTTKTSKGSN